jgi:hypothetical protein
VAVFVVLLKVKDQTRAVTFGRLTSFARSHTCWLLDAGHPPRSLTSPRRPSLFLPILFSCRLFPYFPAVPPPFLQ